jgi:hypothetical protein
MDKQHGHLLLVITMVFSCVVFAAVVGLMTVLLEQPPSSQQVPLLLLLSQIHAVFFVTAVLAATILPRFLTPLAPASRLLVIFSLLDAPAMFGIVIVLLAGTLGQLPWRPIWYLNYVSTVWMLFTGIRLLIAHFKPPIDDGSGSF